MRLTLGWAVGIGVVLLAAVAVVSVPPYGDFGSPSPGWPRDVKCPSKAHFAQPF